MTSDEIRLECLKLVLDGKSSPQRVDFVSGYLDIASEYVAFCEGRESPWAAREEERKARRAERVAQMDGALADPATPIPMAEQIDAAYDALTELREARYQTKVTTRRLKPDALPDAVLAFNDALAKLRQPWARRCPTATASPPTGRAGSSATSTWSSR